MRSAIVLLISFLALQHIHAQTNTFDSTSTEKWKAGNDHLEYKIIKGNAGKPVLDGNYMQLQVKQVYAGNKDTVLADTKNTSPAFAVLDSNVVPLAYYNILQQLNTGDSLTVRIITDHVFKDSSSPMPPFIEKGKYLYTCIKLLNIFESAKLADSADKAERKIAKPRIYADQMATIENEIAANKSKIESDGKLIEAYLRQKNIKAQKTKWGTYFVVSKEGSGKQVDNKSLVSVNYTGKLMKTGKVFDSNIMPSFHHVAPYEVDMGELKSVIAGFYDGILQLKKGATATLYIPSSLAYGNEGYGRIIKAGAILVFEIRVLTVKGIQ